MLAGLAGAGATAGWAWAANRGSGPSVEPDPATSAATSSTRAQAISGPAPSSTTAAIAPATSSTEPPSTTTATTEPPPPPTTAPAPGTTSSTTSTTTVPPTTTIVLTGSGDLQAICKTAWGGREAAGGFTTHAVERMTVHHTAALLDTNRNAPARVRQHQRFHIDDRGWPDLAYHFIVDARGHVYEGRPVTAAGDTGTNYDPTGHFLVCAEGDFNRQGIPAAQVATVVDLLAWGSVHFKL